MLESSKTRAQKHIKTKGLACLEINIKLKLWADGWIHWRAKQGTAGMNRSVFRWMDTLGSQAGNGRDEQISLQMDGYTGEPSRERQG